MNRLAAFGCAVLLGLSMASDAFGWGAVTGPAGGAAYRGPAGGAAVRTPSGAAAVRTPSGAAAVRGPAGAAAVRGPYGGVAARGPYGAVYVGGECHVRRIEQFIRRQGRILLGSDEVPYRSAIDVQRGRTKIHDVARFERNSRRRKCRVARVVLSSGRSHHPEHNHPDPGEAEGRV